jgi:diguanylate cyclase (GGDEF)-like protein
VLFVDLDRFKNVNDSLGHPMGDQLLVQVARKLQQCVRPTDTVARFGGDEFAILLEDLESATGASEVAERILQSLSESVRLDTHEIVTTASIGIVLGTRDYESADELLRDADAAMYRAKDLGKARYEVFDASLREHVRARLDCEADLRRAIEYQELELAYQPVVSFDTGRISGFEALARWQRNGRAVPPSDFIPLAEETGLIPGIEQLLILRACQQLADWQRQFPLEAPLTMNVNLSGRHLREPGLVDYLCDVLAETQPLPGTVRLEITESVLLANDSATNALLEQIRELGFKLVLDDFGTGYSSLSYLQRLPVDAVKLDRSFVQGMESSADGAAIVKTVVALAKQLSLAVVAEGVETINELERLRRFGCDMAQGFLFSRPVDADAATALVAREISIFDCSKRPRPRKSNRVRRSRLVA